MNKRIETISGRRCHIYESDKKPQALLIQTLGKQELGSIDGEVDLISKMTGTAFTMSAFEIGDWEEELTPWHDPEVSHRKEVGEHAFDTLDYITGHLLPYFYNIYGKLPVVLGGYSLGGLFSRWAVCKSDCFDAAACCSPSLWIDAWLGFSDAHEVMAHYVYLSLGDREEFTKNKAMAQVGDNVRWEYKHLKQVIGPENCTLEWNPGNHFREGQKRTAKGFAWCLRKLTIDN